MKRIILCLFLFLCIRSQAQQINPVPDYVFANRMSVGRNAVTDTAAYFSIGPRYGAIRGMMPPMVTDTASVSGTKRNGLLIFSIQKNKYLYWDSVGSKWAEMAGTAGSAITGSGVAGYMPEFTTSTNLDTTRLYHSAGRFGIGTTSPANELHVFGNIRLGASNAYQIGNDDKSFSITNRVTNTRALVIDTANSIFFGTLTTANGAGSTLSVNMQNSSVNVANTLNVTDTATFSGRGLFNDRVGIGTSAPARLLHVNGTNGRVRVTGGNHGLEFDDGRTGFLSGGTDIIHIYTAGNVRGVFQADGEFLVNTTTDAGAYALQVAGSIYNTSGAVFAHTSGSVGIGTVNPAYTLDVSGTMRVRTGTFFQESSGNAFFDQVPNSTNAAIIRQTRGAQIWWTGVGGNGDANWNVYDATAAAFRLTLNTAGELLIGTTTDAGAYALQVAGAQYVTGSGVFDPTATGSNYLYVGTTSIRSISGIAPGAVQVVGNAGNTGGITIAGQLANNSFGDHLQFVKSRGTSNVSVQNSDRLGTIMWAGADGTNYLRAASIQATIDGTPGTNDMPTRLEFSVTSDGTSVPTYRMALNNAGELIIQDNPTDAGNYKLQVDGAIYNTSTITTGAPTGGSIKPWRLGEAATVSPTSPNRTIRVEIDGTVYYIHAKTTND